MSEKLHSLTCSSYSPGEVDDIKLLDEFLQLKEARSYVSCQRTCDGVERNRGNIAGLNSLAVVSAGAACDGGWVESRWAFVENRWESSYPYRWAGDPVERRNPVETDKSIYYCDLSETYGISGPRITDTLLPMAAGTAEIDRLSKAGIDLGEIEKVMSEITQTACGPNAKC